MAENTSDVVSKLASFSSVNTDINRSDLLPSQQHVNHVQDHSLTPEAKSEGRNNEVPGAISAHEDIGGTGPKDTEAEIRELLIKLNSNEFNFFSPAQKEELMENIRIEMKATDVVFELIKNGPDIALSAIRRVFGSIREKAIPAKKKVSRNQGLDEPKAVGVQMPTLDAQPSDQVTQAFNDKNRLHGRTGESGTSDSITEIREYLASLEGYEFFSPAQKEELINNLRREITATEIIFDLLKSGPEIALSAIGRVYNKIRKSANA